MMPEKKIIVLIVLLLLANSAGASALPGLGAICTSSISSTNPNGSLTSSNITSLVTVSMFIVLAVLITLGILYAIGAGFGIESLSSFTKTEVIESVFNIILIGLIAAGLANVGGLISFVTNLGLSGFEAASATPVTLPQISSSYDLYSSLCTIFIGKGVDVAINNVIFMSTQLFILNVLKETKVSLMPNNVGIIFEPFLGLDPVISVLNNQMNIFLGIITLYVGLAFLIIFIYNVFPIFLYAGVLLRSLPWTRPAGGSLLAFFIAFYIIFPALIYPFEINSIGGFTSSLLVSSTNPLVSLFSSISSLISFFVASATGLFGTAMVIEMGGFAASIANIGLQFIGVVIGLLISYDLVEALGDLLGAPSLHSRTLLSKVI